jgi:uncharacterized membrane protein YphA (DoxX/SURF4 family)
LNAIGFLGASLVILFILGYTTTVIAVIGGLMLAVSTYSMYIFHQDIGMIAYALAYQTSMMTDEENEEDN